MRAGGDRGGPRRRRGAGRRRRALLVAERDAALAAALERLDERDRQVIACRYLLELSEAETAAGARLPRRDREVAPVAGARSRLRAQPETGGLDA